MPYILLVRHAQSANNALPVHLRVCDPGLTPLGYQQAEATARALTDYPIRTLYCSPFLRSLETTQAVANGTGKNPVIHGDLFEQGGCYSGHVAGSERENLAWAAASGPAISRLVDRPADPRGWMVGPCL